MSEPGHIAKYGILLQVKEVSKVKAFYRDVLELGEPLLDSTYYVEFLLPGGGLLVLQHCEYAESDVCGDTSWLLFCDDPNEVLSRLKEKGVVPVQPTMDIPGRKCTTFSDPEGNLFTVYSRSN